MLPTLCSLFLPEVKYFVSRSCNRILERAAARIGESGSSLEQQDGVCRDEKRIHRHPSAAGLELFDGDMYVAKYPSLAGEPFISVRTHCLKKVSFSKCARAQVFATSDHLKNTNAAISFAAVELQSSLAIINVKCL